MKRTRRRMSLLLVVVATSYWAGVSITGAEEESARQPSLQFFFYDSRNVEWVTSAEPDRFANHLDSNPTSAALFESFSQSVDRIADVPQARLQMTRWIEQERSQFNGYNAVRFRKAEGIVAYLRAHDFNIDSLVRDLLQRSGADDVQVVAIHLVDASGESTFLIKVRLPGNDLGLSSQGFNVSLPSQKVTYTSIVYSLGVALYELQELVNSEPSSAPPENSEFEELPVPVVPSVDF